MAGIEWRAVSPEEMIQEIERSVKRHREDKYAFQNGLRDLDFDINQAQIVTLGLSIPLRSIDEAEQALKVKAISPVRFFEFDGTEHSVLFFRSSTRWLQRFYGLRHSFIGHDRQGPFRGWTLSGCEPE